jgi:hypothetical protein
MTVKHNVLITKKALKTAQRMPMAMQQRLALLVDDLRDRGPVRAEWPNYSRIAGGAYHCHLGRKWVACWRIDAEAITIEVYYAGSRENAPY